MQTFSDLQNENDDDFVVTVFITGNPGSGKSQIARQVGRKFADENPDSNSFVMTLDAESEETLFESYKRFSRELGITEYSLGNIVGGDSKLTKKEQITHLKSFAFSKVREYSTWLLILDNVDESESLCRFLSEKEERGGCGQVLVTTQESIYLPFGDPSCKEVSLSEGMQVNDALNLLRSISQFSPGDDEEEHLVLEALDYQPLAIASAALYVRFLHDGARTQIGSASFTWRSYVKKLDKGKRKAMEKIYEKTNMNYPQSMTSAVSLTLQKLVKNAVFERVFHFLAFSSPAPIALDVIVKYVTEMEPDIDELLTAAEISKCCLLVPDADNPALVRVHRVVHDVTKSLFIEKNTTDKVFEIVQSYIETVSPFVQHDTLEFDLQFHLFSNMIAPHLRVFSSHLETSNWVSHVTRRESLNEAKKVIFSMGDICSKQGYLPEAMKYFECALEITSGKEEENDDDKAFIAEILDNTGVVFLKQGMFQEAKEHHQRALNRLGYKPLNPGQTSSREVADSLNKLGNVFYTLSHFGNAKDYFIRSLKMREEFCGEEDIAVASSLNNLGSIYSVLGENHIAKDYYQRSLALAKKRFGETHPQVANCLNNLGIVHCELDETREAEEYLEEAFEMRKKLYQPNHLVISESYNNLGLMYRRAGQSEKAMDCFKTALSIRERVLDQEHPAIAEALSNLGQVYMDLGDLKESKNCHFRAMDIRMEKLESDHSEVGDSMLNLGMVFEQCGELCLAAHHYRRGFEIYTKHYPLSHHLCQTAEECLKRVSQRADLNDPSLNRPDNFKARIWSSMKKSLRRSMILDYPLAGSHYNRMIQNSNNSLFGSLSLDDHLLFIIAALLGQYVECKQDENSGFLSPSLEVIPYLVCLTVALRAIEAEYAFSDFSLHRELVFLGFLYLLAYFLQSYL
ncbi:uncharacterized protein LOC111328292 [Stylophora pistillata]|uniref:uncharacterized protein LOC111328292 n=1 Tax=Stylophora pistillata TaxID=50429 RepID=UPI000C04EC58|nr:uncharacterized protein LOC111328292 [Stylophora pistillata]